MLWGWDWAIGNFRRQTYFLHPHPRLHKPPFLNWIPKLMCPIKKSKIFLTSPPLLDVYRGALQYQMDTGVRLTLPKAGAFGENTDSKNDRSLGEKPNFGSKLGGIVWECYFWSFSEHFKGCGMGPWLVLVSPCFRENVVATCKIGSILCSLDNLVHNCSLFWKSNFKMVLIWNKDYFLYTFHIF